MPARVLTGVCRASFDVPSVPRLKLISGVITGRHVIRHGAVIVREFGAAAYFRCCMAILMRRRTTFLECVCRLERAKAMSVPPSQRN